jgi:hypothetical protein
MTPDMSFWDKLLSLGPTAPLFAVCIALIATMFWMRLADTKVLLVALTIGPILNAIAQNVADTCQVVTRLEGKMDGIVQILQGSRRR